MKTKILPLIALFIMLVINAKSQNDQTISITPLTLDCGRIELLNTTSGTHNFTAIIGAGTAQTIYIEAYEDDGYSQSSTWTVSTDGVSFATTKTITSVAAGDTIIVYLKCSPTADIITEKQALISVRDADWANFDEITPSVIIKYPEIDILGNNTSIPDGDATPDVLDYTDFGNVSVNSNHDVIYTIKNTKGGPLINKGILFLKLLSGTYVTITGANASMFTLFSAPNNQIAYDGGTTTFTIRFTPTSTGTKTATLTIYNNDLNESTYNFDIQGTGTASLATVSATNAITGRTTGGGSSGGNITSNGGSSVTARGVCWNTATGPTTANSSSSDGTGTGTFSSTITGGLASGTLYYVRAYATNSAGDAYGPEQTFYTLSSEPTANGSALTVDSKTSSSMNLSWTSGSGEDGYIILKKQGATPPTITGIVDGVKHTSFSLPVGTEVVGEVAEPTHTITASGLTAETQYSFLVIAFARDGHDDTYNYKTDNTSTVTATTVAAAPTVQASNIVWGTPAAGSMEFSWNSGNGDGVIFLIKAGSVPSNPVNGTTYTATTNFNTAPNLGDGTKVVYFGSSSKGNLVVTNLDNEVNYFFKVLGYNNVSEPSYNMTETGGHNVGNSEDSYLPISLVSFDVSLVNNKALVEWKTSSEKDNDYFTIEKSTNLLEWNTVSIVKGAGNSNNMISYRLLDENPSNGFSYYRLKQTDFDGKYTYSEAVSLNNQNGKEVEVVYVSNGKLIIVSNSISASPVKAEIYSISGQRVYSGEFSTGVGNTISIPMNGQKQGLYILRLSNIVSSKVYKFVY